MPEVTLARAVGPGPRLLVALLVVVAVAFVGWSSFANIRVPAPSHHDGGLARAVGTAFSSEVVAATAADDVSSDTTERTAEETGASIEGVLLDAAGAPLVGVRVELQRKGQGLGSGTRFPVHCESGRLGKFSFSTLDPGAYELSLAEGWSGAGLHAVELAAGEVRHLEFRLLAEGTVVTGCVTRNGQLAPGCRIAVMIEGGTSLGLVTDSAGIYHCYLPPGRHVVEVRSPWHQRAEGTRPVVTKRQIVVPPGAMTLRCDIDMVMTNLEMVATGDLVGEIADLKFHVAGSADATSEAHEFDVDTKGGVGELEVPPGRWTIAAFGRGIASVAPQDVEAAVGVPHLRVEVAVVRAGIVRVAYRLADGRPFYLPTYSPALVALLPDLVAGANRLSCRMIPAAEGPLTGGAMPGYENVPVGPATLHALDREQDGALVHLPFDPIEPVSIDVPQGRCEIAVPVRPRAFVTVIACQRNGREDFRGRIRVFRDDKLVQPACSPQQARWQSFLPPGEYRVVIDRENGRTEDRLFVDRASMVVRLQP